MRAVKMDLVKCEESISMRPKWMQRSIDGEVPSLTDRDRPSMDGSFEIRNYFYEDAGECESILIVLMLPLATGMSDVTILFN